MDALRWLDDAAITEALLQDCRNGLHQEAAVTIKVAPANIAILQTGFIIYLP